MLQTIVVNGRDGASTIAVGEQLANLPNYLPAKARLFIVTDANVRQHYADAFPPAAAIVDIGLGEEHKTLATVEAIYRQLAAAQADRQAFVVGIGGGIVCDVAGFAASTYLRGLRFGFVATTLLAQVDASVGGKNGVNLDRYKNIVGTFNQPQFVICDPRLLATLPAADLGCGFAEIVKHMLIADAPMLDWFEARLPAALARDQALLARLVEHSVRIKAGVVSRDERENGERRHLNFGHTLGHAVEKLAGLPHGHAVAIGMVAAAKLSCRRGRLATAEVDRIRRLLAALDLPTTCDLPADALLEAMARDKKRDGDHLNFVLLDGLGKAVVEAISLAELKTVIREML